jgi:hypothetical protein
MALTTKDVGDSTEIEGLSLHCSSNIEVHSVAVVNSNGEKSDTRYSNGAPTDPAKYGSFKRDPGDFYKAVCASRLDPKLQIFLPEKLEEACVDITYTVHVEPPFCLPSYACSWNLAGGALAGDTRPSGWMPCLESPFSLIDNFELQLLVPSGMLAVASGSLKSVQRSPVVDSWHMYQFSTPFPCSPCDIAFVVGELALSEPMLDTKEGGSTNAITVNHFLPRNSTSSSVAGYLASFDKMVIGILSQSLGGAMPPLSSMNIVFLPREAMPASLQQGLGFQAICLDDVPSLECIELSLQLRCDLAFALAKQWFGFWVRSANFNDSWLTIALQHWLADQFVQTCIGKTDCLYRKYQRHTIVAEMDNGEAPPLAGVSFFGCEVLDFTRFYSNKAAVVLSMMENRAGEQLFKKQVESFFSKEQLVVRAKEFFEELAKAGDYANEVEPFLERWVFGSGAPKISIGVQYTKRGSKLDVGLKQIGCDAAFHSAEKAEKTVGIAGVIKVGIQEGSGTKVDHPLHLGTKGYLTKSLSVNPLVKKIAGKRGRKKKSEEALVETKRLALQNAQHPVQYVRLDPSSEFLCTKHVHQPVRMILNKLRNSRDIVSQAEAIKELSSAPAEAAIEGLVECLEDEKNVYHWSIRCDAARALPNLVGLDGSMIGIVALLSFYKRRFFDADGDTPLRVQFKTIEDLFVTEAVLLSLAKGKFDFDVISFFLECLNGLWVADMGIDNRSLVATFMTCLGELGPNESDLNAEEEKQLAELIHEKAFEILVRYLDLDLADSGNHAVAVACVWGIASLSTSGSCSVEIIKNASMHLQSIVNAEATPDVVMEAACGALMKIKAAVASFEAAVSWGIDLAQNQRELRLSLRVWEELMRTAYRGAKLDWARLEGFMTDDRVDRVLQHAAFVVASIASGRSVWAWESKDKKKSLISLKVDKASVGGDGLLTPEEKPQRPKKISLTLAKPSEPKQEEEPKENVPSVAPTPAEENGPPTKIPLGGSKLKLKLSMKK